MHKLILVHVSHCSDDIIKDFLGTGFRKIFVFDDYIKKLFSGAHLSDYVNVIIVFEVFVHFHDVGMVLNVI